MSFDPKECRQPWESDEHWELRKEFLERYKDEFDEDRLLCLAQVYTNMELLNCSYPEQVEQQVRELALNLTLCRELKNNNKDVLHFVQPEDDDHSGPPSKKMKFQKQMFVPSSEKTQENEQLLLSSNLLKSPEDANEAPGGEISSVPSSQWKTTETGTNKLEDPTIDLTLLATFQNMSNYIRQCFAEVEKDKCRKTLNVVTGRLKLFPIHYDYEVVSEENSCRKLHSCAAVIRGVIVSQCVDEKKEQAQAKAIEQAYKLFLNEYLCIYKDDSGTLHLKPSAVQVADENIVMAMFTSLKKRMKLTEGPENSDAPNKKGGKKDPIQQNENPPPIESTVHVDVELPEGARILHLVKELHEMFPVSHSDRACPAFLLFDNTDVNKAESSGSMLLESASFCHVPLNIEQKHLSNKTGNYNHCKITINKISACEAVGINKLDAKRAACDVLLDFFKKNCYTIKVKNYFRSGGFRVSRELLLSNDITINDLSLSKENVGRKMMQMMGWSGGGIGRGRSGIIEPIMAHTSHERGRGLGFSAHPTCQKFNLPKVEAFLQQFVNSNITTDLIFEAEFTKVERKKIHTKAQAMGLKSSSRGPNHQRQLIISRKYSKEILFNLLIQNKPVDKYQLIPPKNKQNLQSYA